MSTTPPNPKKSKKKAWACDACRRKKIRCDGQPPDVKCSNCTTFKSDCTYEVLTDRENPHRRYIQKLERRLAKAEKLLKEVRPHIELSSDDSSDDAVPRTSSVRHRSTSASRFAMPVHPMMSPQRSEPSASVSPGSEEVESSEDEYIQNTFADEFSRLSMKQAPHRYFGKSSDIFMVNAALKMKNQYSAEQSGTSLPDLQWGQLRQLMRRPHIWAIHPWELPSFQEEERIFEFPEPDLLWSLIDIYFTQINCMSPLLHRPTFEKHVTENVHSRDVSFASVLLLICAIASRYANDPRVFLDVQGAARAHSAGWKWFNQVQLIRRKSLWAVPTLFDLQTYALYVSFMSGTSSPHGTWLVVGIGLRMALDTGAHRRKFYATQRSVEAELWKRAVWVLVSHEQSLCAGLGRPCTVPVEDIDLDPPLECDDEYWLDPDPLQGFRQPPGKPSLISFFNHRLKLSQIISKALQTLYSTSKYKTTHGFVGLEWEKSVLAELDSSLNAWYDTVPDHLRWHPQAEANVFFKQSASLYAYYYHAQIIIHRPFVAASKSSPLSFSCMALCTNAARSICSLIDVLLERSILTQDAIISAFTASLVLLLHMWGGHRMGRLTNPEKGMADIHKCLEFIKAHEERVRFAGALWDILKDLTYDSSLPLPQWARKESRKRPRSSDDANDDRERLKPDLGAEATPWRQERPRASKPLDRPLDSRLPWEQQTRSTSPASFPQPTLPGSGAVSDPRLQSWYHLAGVPLVPANIPFETANTFFNEDFSRNAMDPTFMPPVDGVAQEEFMTDLSGTIDPMAIADRFTPTPAGAFDPQLNTDVVDMWSMLPTGVDLGQWQSYVRQMNEFAEDPSDCNPFQG